MPSIAEFLIERLVNNGVRHVFNVPGDYSLSFCKRIEKSALELVGTTSEENAGFAADAYARVNGLGVVCVTYCVGGFKVANAAAQAFAEKSPLVIISGAPGIKERRKNPLLHHKVRDFDTQQRIFEHMTIDSVLLSDSTTAVKDINRVLSSAIRYKRPVYVELPRDIVSASIHADQKLYVDSPLSYNGSSENV